MDKNISVIILDSNKNSGEIIKSYIQEYGIFDAKFFDNYENGFEFLKTLEEAPIVLIDVSDVGKSVNKIIEDIKLYTTKIIITSTDYSTDSIVKAMRIGAKEFLPKPVIKEDLFRVLRQIERQQQFRNESASKIISVYSNKGGIGKTTIATNLAVELAKTTRDKVALVDLNLQLGDISTFLNLNPPFDVSYVIKNLLNKNEDTLLKAFEEYKGTGMYVLSDPSYIEQSESITPQQIVELFSVLKKVFPYIVIDMSSNIDPNSLKILDCSDLILFTTIVNIPAIRNCQRCLTLFRSRRYPENKVKVLINRYMENDDIKIEDIENTLGERIYWRIPNNYFSIMDAINKGVTLSEVNTNSNIANNFKDFALKISDDIVEQTLQQYNH